MKHYLFLLILNIFIFQSGNSQSDPKQHAGWMQYASLPSRNVQSFIYSLATFTDTYTDLTGTTSLNNGEIWDDPTFIMPMAFPFEINGHAVTELEFYGVGALMQAPTSDPLVYTNIFAFEADLIDRGDLGNTSLSPISYK